MDQKKIIKIKWLYLFAFLVFLFTYFLKTIQPELIFHEQQLPFYYNYYFFLDYIDHPGGLSEYVANFIGQSFYYPRFGAFTIVLCCLVSMLTSKYIFTRLANENIGFIGMFIPVILLFYLIHDYHFPYVVFIKALTAYAFFALVLYFYRWPKFSIISIPILGILLYYFAGSGPLISFMASVLIYYMIFDKSKNRYFIPFISLLIVVIVPFVGYKFVFNIEKETLWFQFIPKLSVALRYSINNILYALFFCLPSLILIVGIIQKIPIKKKRKTIKKGKKRTPASQKTMPVFLNYLIGIAVGALLFASLIYTSSKAKNQHKKNVILVDYYTENEEWLRAIDIALSDQEYDYFVNINYNRAIYNIGKFHELFFHYPQVVGADGLYPDKVSMGEISLPACKFYYELGYISEAIHWGLEYFSSAPYNPIVLKILIKSYLIEGRYNAAKKFLLVLKDGCHQKEFVGKYMQYVTDTTLAVNDPEFIEKASFMPRGQQTKLAPLKFIQLSNTNSSNTRALDYAAMFYLLEHSFCDFMEIHPLLKKAYNNKLPFIYELATLMYDLDTNGKNFDPNKYNKPCKDLFQGYYNKLTQYNRDKKKAQKSLYDTYGNTYLYYLYYVSPLVTNMGITSKNYK